MPLGFDADQDCSDVADTAVAKGVVFVCPDFENLSLDEAEALSDAGLKIVSIWEATAQRALSGAAGGSVDGLHALNMAAALGQPQGSAIYVTADFGETQIQDEIVLAYFAAFKAALQGQGKLGVYAEGAVCQAALDAGIADYTWLAGGMGMRGSRAFLDTGRATIVQDVGDRVGWRLDIEIDTDIAQADAFGGGV